MALITGAGNGIGRGIAQILAKEGATVIIATIVKEEGEQTVSDICKEGGNAYFIQTDVSSEKSIIDMTKKVNEQFGTIHTLVNNAGITVFKSIEEATIEDWNKVINTNLRGMYFVTKHALPLLKQNKKSSIINISSNHSKCTIADSEMYTATKTGINGMTRAMAISLGKYGIRVNAICPGFTNTSHHQQWIREQGAPEEIEKKVLDLHAADRICTPADIGKLALYLASDDSEMMTGSELLIDGGATSYLFHTTFESDEILTKTTDF